jgi:hypothetical protein
MATPAEAYRNDPRRAKNVIVSDINGLYSGGGGNTKSNQRLA